MDRQQIEGYLSKVAAYRASGLKASEWAPAHGVTVRQLASWSAHAARWQARLDGVEMQRRRRVGQASFVAGVLPAVAADVIKVEVPGAGGTVTLHWPLSQLRELATWLREMR